MEKANSGDVIQGGLGDCWLLGAMAIVATRPDLIRPLFAGKKVESFNLRMKSLIFFSPGSSPEHHYYIVKFFILGEWRWVVVDDALPVGSGGELRFARNRDPNEFWVSILEKGYAKLFRSYGALEGGNTAEALCDLTGEGKKEI